MRKTRTTTIHDFSYSLYSPNPRHSLTFKVTPLLRCEEWLHCPSLSCSIHRQTPFYKCPSLLIHVFRNQPLHGPSKPLTGPPSTPNPTSLVPLFPLLENSSTRPIRTLPEVVNEVLSLSQNSSAYSYGLKVNFLSVNHYTRHSPCPHLCSFR